MLKLPLKNNHLGFVPVVIVIVAATLVSVAVLIIQKTQPLKPNSEDSTPTATLTASPSASLTSKLSPTATATSTLAPAPKPTPIPTPVSSPRPPIPPVPVSNAPPGSGYSRQTVSADGQNYTVDIIAADLNTTKVIIDTASDSDCSNNCPALPLAEYVSRSGAYAGINGSFFCPLEYDSCKDKTNSFDTLLMNKNKTYFNSDNNVYSTVPAAIFYAGGARFVSRSLEWGRDTSVDAVIANYPLLVSGGNINFTENPSEPKFGQKGPRNFIAARGNTVFIGVIRGATMGESAKVLHALGMGEALNLDEGGSTALWLGGYIVGPGRNIPNAVLFVRR